MHRLVFDKITSFLSLSLENYMDLQECQRQCGREILRQNLNLEKVFEPFLKEVESLQNVFRWSLYLEVRNNRLLKVCIITKCHNQIKMPGSLPVTEFN